MSDAQGGSWRAVTVGAGLLAAMFIATAVLAGDAASGRGPAGRLVTQRYAIDATVLQSRDHGPQLCAGGIAESLPPQCGGFPVVPFRWSDAAGRRSMFGTTWAELHLVGTFDGHAFHPTVPPVPAGPPPPPDTLAGSPCPPPPGGWAVVDSARVGEADVSAALTDANRQPDVAGVWFSWPAGVVPEGSSRRAVLNLAFTGDLERHARDARTHWGGALCATRLARTRTSLAAVNDDIFKHDRQAARAGVYLLGGGPDEPANTVKLEVLIADPTAQQWFDRRYGPGVVTLDGRLLPIP